MDQDKKDILLEQTLQPEKGDSTLTANFNHVDTADEVNCLMSVSDNLKEW